MSFEMDQTLRDEAQRLIREFYQDEYGENASPAGNYIPLAYSTIDDSTGNEHDWQTCADLNRYCFVHMIDREFKSEDNYSDLECFVSALVTISFDDLYSFGCGVVEKLEAEGKFEEV